MEVVTRHHARQHGQTKYGISRTLRVILDLLTVKYILTYFASPMKLFGTVGLGCVALSILALLGTVGMKMALGFDMTGNPLLLLTAFSMLAGIQFCSLGLLGEVSARIYYGSQHKQHYAVRKLLNLGPAPEDAYAPRAHPCCLTTGPPPSAREDRGENTVKAAYIEQTGPPECIQYGDLPRPAPAATQVLVRVKAAALNPIDTYLRGGAPYWDLPQPYIPGCDLAGVVESVGAQSSGSNPEIACGARTRDWLVGRALLPNTARSTSAGCIPHRRAWMTSPQPRSPWSALPRTWVCFGKASCNPDKPCSSAAAPAVSAPWLFRWPRPSGRA